MARRSAIILHLLHQSRFAVPACRPEALINKAVERAGVFETQSFHPAFRSLSNNSVQWGHSSAALQMATTGTKQHSPAAAARSI